MGGDELIATVIVAVSVCPGEIVLEVQVSSNPESPD
jgi:hypothetical protein